MSSKHSTAVQRSATQQALVENNAFDKLNCIKYLVEAIFMACNDLGDRTQTDALQYLCEKTHGDIKDLYQTLEAM